MMWFNKKVTTLNLRFDFRLNIDIDIQKHVCIHYEYNRITIHLEKINISPKLLYSYSQNKVHYEQNRITIPLKRINLLLQNYKIELLYS